jgi:hypothetical protein
MTGVEGKKIGEELRRRAMSYEIDARCMVTT